MKIAATRVPRRLSLSRPPFLLILRYPDGADTRSDLTRPVVWRACTRRTPDPSPSPRRRRRLPFIARYPRHIRRNPTVFPCAFPTWNRYEIGLDFVYTSTYPPVHPFNRATPPPGGGPLPVRLCGRFPTDVSRQRH